MNIILIVLTIIRDIVKINLNPLLYFPIVQLYISFSWSWVYTYIGMIMLHSLLVKKYLNFILSIFIRIGIVIILNLREPLLVLSIFQLIIYKDFIWIIIYIEILFLQFIIEQIVSYATSFSQMKLFEKNFLSSNRDYQLFDYKLDEKLIDIKKEFDFLFAKYEIAENLDMTTKDLNVLKKPVRFYFAKSISNKVFHQCKAYIYIHGYAFIVLRTNNVERHPFEKFLFFHEIEHINFRGIISYLQMVTMQINHLISVALLILMSIFYGFLIDSLLIIILSLLFSYELFINLPIRREQVADSSALLRLNQDERESIVIHLKKLFQKNILKSKTFLKKNEYKKRLNNIYSIEKFINDTNIDISKFFAENQSQENKGLKDVILQKKLHNIKNKNISDKLNLNINHKLIIIPLCSILIFGEMYKHPFQGNNIAITLFLIIFIFIIRLAFYTYQSKKLSHNLFDKIEKNVYTKQE